MSDSASAIAVDVGNSAVKIAVDPKTVRSFMHQEAVHQEAVHQETNWIEEAVRWVTQSLPNRRRVWWISSVNQTALVPLLKAVETLSDAVEIVDAAMVPIDLNVDQPDRVGRDRVLSAFAGSLRSELPCVVVDAGSAVTVDWVDRADSGQTVFAGGAILPGLRLQLSALSAGTEAIRVQEEARSVSRTDPFSPGQNTQQAIRLGAGAAVIGGIDRLIVEYRRHFGFSSDDHTSPSVLITGGDASILSDYLQARHRVIPHLVCLGLLDLAEHFAKPHSGA
ncbi:MAG: type III pantothenate kinase [Planctomycetota bacterium]